MLPPARLIILAEKKKGHAPGLSLSSSYIFSNYAKIWEEANSFITVETQMSHNFLTVFKSFFDAW